MYRGNLLWCLQFHSAEAHNPQVFLTPRPGSIPAKAHKSWAAGQWAVPHAFTELPPFSRGGLLITKSTEASTVWMTSVRLMSASKLTPPKAVLHCHKSFVSKAARLKNAPKHSLSCFYHCPHPQSTWGPSSLVLSKMTNMSHLIHSFFPSQENLGTVNCFHRALVSCISAAVPRRGGKVKETPLKQRGKEDKLFVMASGFCEDYSRASAWLVFGSGKKRS